MQVVKIVVWQDGDTWIGYLQELSRLLDSGR